MKMVIISLKIFDVKEIDLIDQAIKTKKIMKLKVLTL